MQELHTDEQGSSSKKQDYGPSRRLMWVIDFFLTVACVGAVVIFTSVTVLVVQEVRERIQITGK